MPTKPREINPDYYYHVYNCGIEKRTIFQNPRDYKRFLEVMLFYLHKQSIRFTKYLELDEAERKTKLQLTSMESQVRVKLLAYCLMPNHFHLVLKPISQEEVVAYISDICNSHARYFNLRYQRVGKLFQGPFKSKEIQNDESLAQLTRYVHLNPVFSRKTNPNNNLKVEDYNYSSYPKWVKKSYIHPSGVSLLHNDELEYWIRTFGGREKYKSFVESKLLGKSEVGIEDIIIEEI